MTTCLTFRAEAKTEPDGLHSCSCRLFRKSPGLIMKSRTFTPTSYLTLACGYTFTPLFSLLSLQAGQTDTTFFCVSYFWWDDSHLNHFYLSSCPSDFQASSSSSTGLSEWMRRKGGNNTRKERKKGRVWTVYSIPFLFGEGEGLTPAPSVTTVASASLGHAGNCDDAVRRLLTPADCRSLPVVQRHIQKIDERAGQRVKRVTAARILGEASSEIDFMWRDDNGLRECGADACVQLKSTCPCRLRLSDITKLARCPA